MGRPEHLVQFQYCDDVLDSCTCIVDGLFHSFVTRVVCVWLCPQIKYIIKLILPIQHEQIRYLFYVLEALVHVGDPHHLLFNIFLYECVIEP